MMMMMMMMMSVRAFFANDENKIEIFSHHVENDLLASIWCCYKDENFVFWKQIYFMSKQFFILRSHNRLIACLWWVNWVRKWWNFEALLRNFIIAKGFNFKIEFLPPFITFSVWCALVACLGLDFIFRISNFKNT